MTFAVEWTEPGGRDLHRISIPLADADQAALAQTALAVEQTLTTDPEQQGIHLFDTVYALTVAPLRVEYEVQTADRRVLILAVRYVGSP